MNKKQLINNLIYLYVCSVFIGPSMLSIDIGIMHISLGRILLPILLFCAIYQVIKEKLSGIRNTMAHKYTIYFFIFWLIYALLTYCWSIDTIAWLRNYYFLFCGVITISIFSLYIDSINEIKNISKIIMYMTLFHALLGVYEIYTGNYFFLSDEVLRKQYAYWHFPATMYSNVNDFATMMLIGVFSSMITFCTTKSQALRIFSLLNAGIMVIMCVISESRANIIGLVGGLFICSFMAIRYNKYNIGKIVKYATPIVLFIVISMITVDALQSQTKKVWYLLISFDITNLGTSDTIRLNLIKNGIIFLKEHLYLGIGLGQIEAYMAIARIYDTGNIVNIHNWWMEILVTSGVFVFVAYCLVYFDLFSVLNKYAKVSKQNDIKNISCIFCGFLSSFIIASISSSSIMGADIIWMYFAIIIAFKKIVLSQDFYHRDVRSLSVTLKNCTKNKY